MLKRAVDLAIATLGLLILLPFLLVVAVLIKIDSHGPVFFRQARVGLNGRTFRIFKFRSMVTGRLQDGLAPDHQARSARHPGRTDPALVQDRRAAAAHQRPEGRDEPDRAAPRGPALRPLLQPDAAPGAVGPSRHGRTEPDPRPRRAGELSRGARRIPRPTTSSTSCRRSWRATSSTSSTPPSGATCRCWRAASGPRVRGAVKTKFLWRRRHRVALFARRLRA